MAPRDSHDAGEAPEGIKGFATLAELRVGVKAYVEKQGEKRRAEILSIQARRGQPTYYVHYEEFNKRLDEWVAADRIDLTQEVEWPAPEKPDEKKNKKAPASQKNLKRPRAALERADSGTPDSVANIPGKAPQPSQAGGKENSQTGDIAVISTEIGDGTSTPGPDDEISLMEIQDAAAAAKAAPPGNGEEYSREAEIEKLRTSGSMTQNQAEISRVRNLMRVQMGRYEIEPWYFSPYPQEFTESDMVYICEFCLDYFPSYKMFSRHRAKCEMQHPPGNEIYRDDKISFFEIDGRRQRTWCRNLCLLSKLFLDHKTLYYDVDPFLFYCMTVHHDPLENVPATNGNSTPSTPNGKKAPPAPISTGHHLTGYFSKEKESAEGYNVACILTLPQFQRRGYGRLLISFSYELSKRESKLGSPEKPLSDLGLLGYRAYWQETIVDLLMDRMNAGEGSMSVEEIGAASAMTTTDVLHTLQNLNMLRFAKNQHVIVLSEAVMQRREKQKEKEKLKGKHYIDPEKLIWKPPVFTASSRTWNW